MKSAASRDSPYVEHWTCWQDSDVWEADLSRLVRESVMSWLDRRRSDLVDFN